MLNTTQWVFVLVAGYCLLLSIWSWFVLAKIKNIYRLLADPGTQPWALRNGQYEYFVRTVQNYYLPSRIGREFIHWLVITALVFYCWYDVFFVNTSYTLLIALIALAIVFMVFQAYFKLRLFSTYLIVNGFVLEPDNA